MGFRYRNRTKGSSSWLNFSKRSGGILPNSISFKVGKSTFNLSGKHFRSTLNLGNGYSYSKQRSLKKKSDRPRVERVRRDWSGFVTWLESIAARSKSRESRKTEPRKAGIVKRVVTYLVLAYLMIMLVVFTLIRGFDII